MASENMPPLAALRKKTYEHIANSRDRNPEYARALTLNLLEEQKLRSTMVLLDRQKTAEISKFRLEHRAFLSRAKSATEQLSRESLGESRGIRRPWSEFGTAARVQFQSAEARLVHGGGSRTGTARHNTATGPGFYTHCHHCARRYIRSTVTAGSGREPEEDVYSLSVTPDTCDDAEQLADKDRWARKSNPRFTVTLNIPQKLSRPTSAATDRSAITSPAAKPPRRPATENGPTAAWAGRRRASIDKTKSVSKQGPSLSQFVSNGATRDNVTSLDDSSGKNKDRISTGSNYGNGDSAPSGQYRNDRQVLNENESLPLKSPRGRWFWAYRAVVEANRSRQRQGITGDQGTPTSKNVIKPTKGTRKKKRKGQTDTGSKDRNAKYVDKTGGGEKDGENSSQPTVHNTEGHKVQSSILPVPVKARWLWAMHAVLRAKNNVQMKTESQNSIDIAHKMNILILKSTENRQPCTPKDRWVWAMKVIISHKKSAEGSKKAQSRPEKKLSIGRSKKNPRGTQQNPSTAKGRWLWAMKAVRKQAARRRYNATGSEMKCGENDGLPSHPKLRWHWAMRAVLKNKGTIKKQEQPSTDENHAKKRSETTIYSKTKATKTETPTPRPVTQKRGKRNSTALVNSFHGNASYTHQTASGSFGKSGSKTRSVRRRPLKFDPRSLLKQTKEQEKQKESYEDMMEKFKKLRNCRYLRWRNGQDPYMNDTFDMPEQTRIVTLPLPLTTGGKLDRKPSFRQTNRSFFSASVVAVTSVGVSQK